MGEDALAPNLARESGLVVRLDRLISEIPVRPAVRALHLNDVAIGRERTPERDANGVGTFDVLAVECLDMKVGFGAVAGVPAPAEHVTGLDLLPRMHRDTALLQMTQRDDGAAMFDQDMVSGKCHPAFRGTLMLGHCVTDRRQAAIRMVVWLTVMCGHNNAVNRGQDRASETGESVGRLRPHERAKCDRGGASSIGNGNEVDGVVRGE